MLGFFVLLGISVLAKGLPGVAVAGLVAALWVLFGWKWNDLFTGGYELRRGFVLLAIIAVPWHYGMYVAHGAAFTQEYLGTHLIGRAFAGVFGERGTFNFYLTQIGYGMFPWIGLLPFALKELVTFRADSARERATWLFLGIWGIVAFVFFSLVQTKFHHYVLPAVAPLTALCGLALWRVITGRSQFSWVFAVAGTMWNLAIAQDMMSDSATWIEMFVFRFDRPWPNAEPWSVDISDGFFAVALASSVAFFVLASYSAWRARKVSQADNNRCLLLGGATAVALAIPLWNAIFAAHVYMPIAGKHWGMRDGLRQYFSERDIYGAELVYFDEEQLANDWKHRQTWQLETYVPRAVILGQAMTVRIDLRGASAQMWQLRGTVSGIGEHSIDIALDEGQTAKLTDAIANGEKLAAEKHRMCPLSPAAVVLRAAHRQPDLLCEQNQAIRLVDASRLFGWGLYWRGEVFWTNNASFGPLPSYQTSSGLSAEPAFLTNYLSDMTKAVPGRRYFVMSEARSIAAAQNAIPSELGKSTFEIINTDSNKFSLAVFRL